MALQVLGLFFLSTLVRAQNDTITAIGLPDPIVAGTFLTFDYVFSIGKAGHVVGTPLRSFNITSKNLPPAAQECHSRVDGWKGGG
jgi:hypothetical protein